MTAEKIAELKRLWAATQTDEGSAKNAWHSHQWQRAIWDAFPGLVAALEAATAERDALQEESTYVKHQLEWVEENGDTYTKSALMDFIRRTLHAINHTSEIKEAIAARDARLKNEGAIEILERLAGKVGHQYTGTRRYTTPDLLREAAELRKKGGA